MRKLLSVLAFCFLVPLAPGAMALDLAQCAPVDRTLTVLDHLGLIASNKIFADHAYQTTLIDKELVAKLPVKGQEALVYPGGQKSVWRLSFLITVAFGASAPVKVITVSEADDLSCEKSLPVMLLVSPVPMIIEPAALDAAPSIVPAQNEIWKKLREKLAKRAHFDAQSRMQ